MRDAAAQLRAGGSVVLLLPPGVPEGLRDAIRTQAEESRYFRTLVVESDRAPIERLYDEFGSEDSANSARTVATLAHDPRFVGHLVWLSVSPDAWRVWSEFLSAYQHACRAMSEIERTVFVVPAIAQAAENPPPEDVALTHHAWRGAVSMEETRLYCWWLLRASGYSPSARRLLAAVIAWVALWDGELAERLSVSRAEEVLGPGKLLSALASERGWSASTPLRWELGTLGLIDAREETHSAMLELVGQGELLQRRLWAAQLGVVLPAIEEQRRVLVDRFGARLKPPFMLRDGIVNDPADLEIGQLVHVLRLARVNDSLVNHTERLWCARNDLAHGRVLPAEAVLSKELFELPRLRG